MTGTTHSEMLNLLITSFAGLGLPRTLSLPVSRETSVTEALHLISSRLPATDQPLAITTTSNQTLRPESTESIAALADHANILPLRLSVPILGGKGGFGSQLRAAGGRMSSRKKNRDSNINPNGSNRNLDGRRLRTVDEAKRLAEYLAIKPEMERKEKEERRKRWEAVVETSEKREEEIKRGGAGAGRLDSEWVDAKQTAEERVRESVMKAMREMNVEMEELERTGSESDVEDEQSESEDEQGDSSGSSEHAKPEKQEAGRTFFGWDEDEDESDEEEEEGKAVEAAQSAASYEEKGKGKAT